MSGIAGWLERLRIWLDMGIMGYCGHYHDRFCFVALQGNTWLHVGVFCWGMAGVIYIMYIGVFNEAYLSMNVLFPAKPTQVCEQ